MQIKIAVISDLHFGPRDLLQASSRRGDLADVLLTRVVRQVNRFVRPDVTLVLGDLLADGESRKSERDLRRLHEILSELQAPWLAVPGNHDGTRARFESVLGALPKWLDVGGFRILPFVDAEEPGFNARRAPSDQARLAEARSGFCGSLIAVQHMSVHPPGTSACPFNLVNAPETIRAMHEQGVLLSVGGHYHAGLPLAHDGAMWFLGAPSLSESPFPYLEVDIDDARVSVTRRELCMPRAMRLVDYHVHTPYAYCNENMETHKAVELAREFGLAGLVFTEHSSHLYLSRSKVRDGVHFHHPMDRMDALLPARAQSYFDSLERMKSPHTRVGMELDCTYDGRPFARASDAARCQVRVGAIHQIPELRKARPDLTRAEHEYMGMLVPFLNAGIHILAHPFRVFRWNHFSPPEKLFRPVCHLLKEHHVAAELNYHCNEPVSEFVRMCVEEGVKLSFGSDSHSLCEIGDFMPHIELLRSLGYTGDISELLVSVTATG